MKATKKTTTTTTTTVMVEMEEHEARALVTFLRAESRRRRRKFAETKVMECWECLQTAEDLLAVLRDQGISTDH